METLPVVVLNRVMMESASPVGHAPGDSTADMDFQDDYETLSMEMGDSSDQHNDIDPLDLES